MVDLKEKELDKAEEAAEKLWREQYQGESAEKETEEKPEVTPPEVVEKPPEGKTPVEADTKVAPIPKEEKPPEKPEDKQPEKTVDWEQKFKTLEGKYKAEVPRTSAELKQWKEQALAMQRKIADLEVSIKASQSKEQDDATEKEIDSIARDYPELAKTLKKVAENHKADLQKVREEVQKGTDDKFASVKTEVDSIKQSNFDIEMASLGVPDWKEIDVDPSFLEWLNEEVPYTKTAKLQFIMDAAKKRDAKQVSKFFLDFKKAKGLTQDGGVVENEQPAPTGQAQLEKYLAPPKGGGGNINLKGDAGGLTRAGYEKFMSETTRGKFSSKDWGGKKEEEVEAMFDKAISEGKLL
jgi:hypothetical protein